MARKHIEHNRLLLTWNMIKGGLNPVQAWREAGKKIARSKAQIGRKKKVKPQNLIDGTYIKG